MVSFRSRVNFCAAPILGQPLRNQKGLQEAAESLSFKSFKSFKRLSGGQGRRVRDAAERHGGLLGGGHRLLRQSLEARGMWI